MQNDEMRAAVERGCEFLDEEHPGWELQLDLGKLNLGDNCTCVLGQLEGGYWGAMERRFGAGLIESRTPYTWAKERGFAWSPGQDAPFASWAERARKYELLTEAWRAVVKERLDRGISIPD